MVANFLEGLSVFKNYSSKIALFTKIHINLLKIITIIATKLVAISSYSPGPIMLFKLPVMLLSNAPNFFLLCPVMILLCSIMLHKFIKLLLPESENKPIILIIIVYCAEINYDYNTQVFKLLQN